MKPLTWAMHSVVVASIALHVGEASGQDKSKKPVPVKKPAAVVIADPEAEARRSSAVAVISTVADNAKGYSDPVLKARAQARSADLLWTVDSAKARDLFRRAWDAAEAGDAEIQRRAEEGRNTAAGRAAAYNIPNLRREVLIMATKRDRALGEEFLAKMEASRKDESPSSAESDAATGQTARIDPDNPPPAMAQRLRLANELLQGGNVERALQVADAALYPVNTPGINFLDLLREKNPAEADARYAALLARAAADPTSDGNSVSLLASYAFTPYLYVIFRADGNSHTRQWGETIRRRDDLPPQLRNAFFGAAANILLRPIVPLEQDLTTTKRVGTYLVIERLLPLFEQYGSEYAPLLKTRSAMLMQDTTEKQRQESSDVVRRGIGPEQLNEDREQDFLERLGRATNQDERDMLYFQAAMGLSNTDPLRAQEFANKIEDLNLRAQLKAVMQFRDLNEAIRAKKAESVIQAARGDALTPVQRAWGLTEAAKLLAQKEPERAAELLEEALIAALKMDKGVEKARAVVSIATQYFLVNRPRAWELASEAVKEANSAQNFTGDDGGLVVRAEFKRGGATTMNFNVESFNLDGLFTSLAKDDYYRALELAKSFDGLSPRTAAMLAVARVGLAGSASK